MLRLIMTILLGLGQTVLAKSYTQSICGDDQRQLSQVGPVGRLVKVNSSQKFGYKPGCSAVMISPHCILTAKHCVSGRKNTHIEFNIKYSKNASDPKDFYPVDFLEGSKKGYQVGDDWAIFWAHPNNITKRVAGEQQGWFPVNFEPLSLGETLRITGYGVDWANDEKNRLQQTHFGKLSHNEDYTLSYVVDTEPGNSGSGILHEATQSIVGVHTNGGCSQLGGNNHGTSVNLPDLKKAIYSCWAREKSLSY